MNIDFVKFPELTTQRLILRKIENHDFKSIHKLHSDPIVNSFVGRDNSSTIGKSKAYITKIQSLVEKRECLCWIITLKGGDDLAGVVSIWNYDIKNEIVELGYEMLPEFQGKGIMSESLKEVIKYTFEKMDAKMITAFPSSDNTKSVTILKKLNFKQENNPYNNTHNNVENLVTYTLRNNINSNSDMSLFNK